MSTTAATQTALHRDAARRSTFYKPSGQPGAPRLAARGLWAAFHGVTETKAQALGGIGIHGAWDHDESGVHGTGPALHRTSRLVLLIAFFFIFIYFVFYGYLKRSRPLCEQVGETAALFPFNFSFLFCDMFRHGVRGAKAGPADDSDRKST